MLAEPELMLTKAVSVAQAAELTDTDVKELQSSTMSVSNVVEKSVHKFTPDATSKLGTILSSQRNIIIVVLTTTLISVISS